MIKIVILVNSKLKQDIFGLGLFRTGTEIEILALPLEIGDYTGNSGFT